METKAVREFGQTLVEQVRDQTIVTCDMILQGRFNSLPAKKLRERCEVLSGTELVGAVLPEIVDRVICELLRAIDHEALRLYAQDEAGKPVDLHEVGEGELVGFYMGPEGWRETYSKQRVL